MKETELTGDVLIVIPLYSGSGSLERFTEVRVIGDQLVT